ncbi:hypothetical protein SAMN05660772_01833 [Pasteurella testudinis DSM 23072]|uniref:Uncharacterized protein n=1 Tax=Pasteurella testudinis DSM 23072 TaxID=1122938 RepID=A0A1W1UKX7_9PAST|nr:hypothetical protein [Pasteurella testudinis]SMB81394.1 hypothetical protein SAMN05660772_01833 [Pasteurella testudinis DSM 23072]SUB51390.1 Uncharacterised protein [Pasteurella testudinis]
MDAASSNAANINTARVNQYENNVDSLNRLIATTNAMKSGSASTLSGIAGNESARQQQAANAKAAKKQQTYSNVGMVAGLAMMGVML